MGTIQPRSYPLKARKETVVRSAQVQDGQALLELTRSVMAEGDFVLTTPEEFQMTMEQEAQWIDACAADPGKIVLVAENHGIIIGMLDFANGTRKRLAHQGEFGMSVLKEWRGLGVGKALLRSLIDWGQATPHIEQIRLAVFSHNEPAICLYTSLGFVQEGRLMNQAKLGDGTYCDLLLMAMMIKI
jgi:RimJ/RimL family protein N-acetyltransferase